jgi:hypothetical protein
LQGHHSNPHFNLLSRCIEVFVLLFVSTLLIAARCEAEDFRSPRSQALGGAGHAAPLLNDAIYMNPSYASFLPTYSVSGNWDWYNYQDGSYNGKLWNVSLQDGRSELFQAGLAYTHFQQGALLNVGAGSAATKKLGFGLGGKVFFPVADPNGNHVEDMIFSTQFVASKAISVSFTADNLIQNSVARQYNYYREFTLGTKYNALEIVSLYYDPHFAPSVGSNRWGWEGGIEFPLFEDFALRGGLYQSSKVPSLNNRGNGWGCGVGWMGPKLSLDYAFSRETTPTDDSEHTLGATIYF